MTRTRSLAKKRIGVSSAQSSEVPTWCGYLLCSKFVVKLRLMLLSGLLTQFSGRPRTLSETRRPHVVGFAFASQVRLLCMLYHHDTSRLKV